MILRIAALLAALTTGCSVLLIDSPKPLPQPPSCELTPWPVIGDSVVAIGSLFTAAGFGIASQITESESHSNAYATTAEVLVVTGIVTAISGGVGFYRLASCSHAIDQWNALHAQPPQQYPQYPPQQYPPQQYPPQQYPPQQYPPQQYPPQQYPPQQYPPQQPPASTTPRTD